MKSTTIEIACITNGKVTQGNWIVSEKNRLVTKQRRNAFRKIRSSKELGFLTCLRVSNGSNDSDDCISINRTARVYSTKIRMGKRLPRNWKTLLICLGQPTKDDKW